MWHTHPRAYHRKGACWVGGSCHCCRALGGAVRAERWEEESREVQVRGREAGPGRVQAGRAAKRKQDRRQGTDKGAVQGIRNWDSLVQHIWQWLDMTGQGERRRQRDSNQWAEISITQVRKTQTLWASKLNNVKQMPNAVLELLDHRWQTQGQWAESGSPPCFIWPGTVFLPGGSTELSL